MNDCKLNPRKGFVGPMALALALVFAAGCAPHWQLSRDFGDAHAHNKRAQVDNVVAGLDSGSPDMDGQKTERALENYRKESQRATTERLILDVGSGRR